MVSKSARYRLRVLYAMPIERDSSATLARLEARAASKLKRRGSSVRPSMLATSQIARWRIVETILTHLGLPTDPPRPSAARTPAWLPGVRRAADHQNDTGGNWAD